MRQVTIDLRKIARGKLYNSETGCMCVMGQILNRVFGVSETKLAGCYSACTLEYNSPAHIKSWLRKHENTIFNIQTISDSHKPWDEKVEKLRPLIKQLGIAPRFIR